MKRLALGILVLFVITFSNAHSQSVYVKLGGGYGLGIASQVMTGLPYLVPNTWNYKYGSYGEGINFQAGLGYNVHPNIALELAGSYTMGKNFENSFGTEPVVNEKDYANTISIMPSAVLKVPLKSLTPYMRFGMVIAIPTKFHEATHTGTSALTGTYKAKETGGIALGINGAVGVNIKANNQLGFFSEIFCVSMNYGPEKSENTENYTGQALQPTITYSESGTITPGDFNKRPTPSYQFSSFGMNVGLTYTFGK
jgi:hypothetical protein